jgi:signal transduction histidine kinase
MPGGHFGKTAGRRSSTTGPVVQFAAAGILAVVLVGAASAALLRDAVATEAIRDAEKVASLAGKGIVEPNLTNGLLRGAPGAIRRMNRLVHDRVLARTGVIRVKIWTADGRIAYSDEPQLIGSKFGLGEEEAAILRTGGVDAEATDLSAPENRFERGAGDVLEVYSAIEAPTGQPLLFETYVRSEYLTAAGEESWVTLAPVLIGALALLAVLQLPLAWSLARRLRRGQEEREALLKRAIEASETERRRIAQDLHDGVVQNLVGVSYGLSAAAGRLGDGSDGAAATLRELAGQTRQSIRELRTLLVDIYPPDLHRAGLQAAFADLTAGLRGHGIETRLDLPTDVELPSTVETVFFRTAQEAVRNVVSHADASNLEISVARNGREAVLEIRDDGRGFSPEVVQSRKGHLGLRLLSDLVGDAGGRWELDTAPGRGTRIRVAVPT